MTRPRNKFKFPRGLYLSARIRADGVAVFRWGMAPGLRKQGIAATDLLDAHGRPLALKPAIARAKELTASLKAGAPAPPPAAAPRRAPRTVGDLLDAFLAPANLDLMRNARTGRPLRPATKSSYRKWRVAIDDVFRDQPVGEIDHLLVRDWYFATMARRGHHMAACAFALLRIAANWADGSWGVADVAWSKVKPPPPPAKLRVGGIDELACLLLAMDDPAALYAALEARGEHVPVKDRIPARPELGDALVLAVWTTQRAADVLAFTEDSVFGGRLRWVATKNQADTGRAIDMPLLGPLADVVNARGEIIVKGRITQAKERKRARGLNTPHLVVSPTHAGAYGQREQGDDFRAARALAARFHPSLIGQGVDAWGRPNKTFTFEDCRDTGITRLHKAGCDILQILSWSNHANPASLMKLIKAYIEIDAESADRAGEKMAAWWAKAGGVV
jgi:hypothetical protein